MGSSNTVSYQMSVSQAMHERRSGQKGLVIWFTGLSGAGKSTLANAVELALFNQGVQTRLLDGDNLRQGLCADLGFSEDDRSENIRRVSEVAKLFVETGAVVLAAFVSPFVRDRERVRSTIPQGRYIEVYCQCDIAICEQRDPKGLYRAARAGRIADFTGISSPYEAPLAPELVIDTQSMTVQQSVEAVLAAIARKLEEPG